MKFLVAICAASALLSLAGCSDEDDDSDSSVVVNPPGPNPDPGPDPTPDPQPDPDPDPDPVSPAWVLQDSGTNLTLTAVAAIKSTLAWTAAATHSTQSNTVEGGFRRTVDGLVWDSMGPVPENQSHVIFSSPTVLDLKFFDDQHGFALTKWSLLSTSDGGQSWNTRLNSLVQWYHAMSFISPSTGFVSSSRFNALSKTTDGGATWTGVGLPGSLYSAGHALKFVNEQTGWITMRPYGSDADALYKTTDGGETWQLQLSLSAGQIVSIAAMDANHAWCIGGGVIWGTTDGGATWTQQETDGSGGLTALCFGSTKIGWCAGRKIHKTTDGGVTWTAQTTEQEWFLDIDFASATTGWAVGQGGVILKTTTAGEQPPN